MTTSTIYDLCFLTILLPILHNTSMFYPTGQNYLLELMLAKFATAKKSQKVRSPDI